MKFFNIAFLLFLFSFCSFSQEDPKVKEIDYEIVFENKTFSGTYVGAIAKVTIDGKKRKGPSGSGTFKGKFNGDPNQDIWIVCVGSNWKDGKMDGTCYLLTTNSLKGQEPDWAYVKDGLSYLSGTIKEGYDPTSLWNKINIFYGGDFSQNQPVGQDFVIKAPSYSYKGEVSNWLPNGRGKKLFEETVYLAGGPLQTVSFEGQFVAGGLGDGIMTLKNGSWLKGSWKNNLYTGNGKLDFKNNFLYEGDWENGLINGKGQINKKDEWVFTGNFEKNEVVGSGELRYYIGNTYTGNFQGVFQKSQIDLSIPNNEKLKIMSQTNLVREGVLKDNEFSGFGEIKIDNNAIYKGSMTMTLIADRIDEKAYMDLFEFKEIIIQQPVNDLIDSRDGSKYKTVLVGSQLWMAENLRYESTNSEQYIYDDFYSNYIVFGYLYDFNAACSVCPSGWRLPSNDDWLSLASFLGENWKSKLMKDEGAWPNTDIATNNIGFSVEPAGQRDNLGAYLNLGKGAYFWSSTPVNQNFAFAREFGKSAGNYASHEFGTNKKMAFSVRCMKNTTPNKTVIPAIKSGEGKISISNGDTLHVNWDQDGYIGTGRVNFGISDDGDSLYSEGTFRNGQLTGQGTTCFMYKLFSDEEESYYSRYEGLFQQGNRHGQGLLYCWKPGFSHSFEGEWSENTILKGTIISTYGNAFEQTYTGYILNFKPFSQGTLKSSEGWTYTGTFKDGVPHGTGKYIYADGRIYEGEMKSGVPNGVGKMTLKNKQVLAGNFMNGEYQKPFTCKQAKIGNQVWMAENLNVDHFRNGDIIPEAKSEAEWINASVNETPAWCYYTDESNGKIYGKLYNWYAVNDPRGLAPDGWHVPSEDEWRTLLNYTAPSGSDYFEDAGTKLKSISLWKIGNYGVRGTDIYKFNALPAGFRHCFISYVDRYSSEFLKINLEAWWWSSTTDGYLDNDGVFRETWNAFSVQMHIYKTASIQEQFKHYGLSVRCLKNN